MRYPVILYSLLFIGFFIVSCSDQQAPNAMSEDTPEIRSLAKFTNGQEMPGIIVRTETGVFLVARDFEKQLISFHTTEALPCGQTGDLFTADYQRIFSPADEILVQELLMSKEHYVLVLDASTPPLTCNDLLAMGTAQLVLTDNDFFAFLRDFPIRANAWGFTAQGTLEDVVNGGNIHYNTVQRFVFFPPDKGYETLKINLK